jgi:hypothetical protein
MNPAAGKLAQELLKKYASAVMSGGGAGVKTALEGSKRLGAIAQGNPEVAAKALSQLPVIGKATMGLTVEYEYDPRSCTSSTCCGGRCDHARAWCSERLLQRLTCWRNAVTLIL